MSSVTIDRTLTVCRATRRTLIVAKLDRLARDPRCLLSIVDGTGEGGGVFCALPQVPVGPVARAALAPIERMAA